MKSTATLLLRLTLSLSFWLLILVVSAQTIDLSRPVGTPSSSGGVNSTGGSSYKIPISVLPGTNGLQPDVSLSYNSQGGDGIAGWGWNLSCVSVIGRAGKNNYYNGIAAPVSYTNTNDAFVLDGQRMFVTSGSNGASGAVYGLENENFSKIESFNGSETQGPEWFRVTTKTGTILEYGHATNTKLAADGGSGSTMLWYLSSITDINGNYEQFIYSISATDRDYALIEIDYTGNAGQGVSPYNRVLFTYTVRSNWQNSTIYDGGASLRRPFNLSNISVSNASWQTVKSYDFAYQMLKNQYFLQSVTERGSDGTSLNPLTFTYGSNTSASDVTTSVQYSGMHQGNVCAGDFNGDGKQDILSSNYNFDNNNIAHYTSYDVLSDFGNGFMGPSITHFYTFAIPQNGAVEVTGTSNGYYNFLTNDYDGDGKEDVLMINSLVSGSDKIYNGISINYSRYYNVYSGSTYETATYPSIPHSFQYAQDFKYSYKNGSYFGNYFVAGDFDGDGAQDYILILGINNSNAFKGFFSSPKKGIFNQEILQFGVEGSISDPFYANSIASAKQLIAIDFDGDGKQEILVVKDNQSYVLSVFPVPASSGYQYAAQVLYSTTAIKSTYPIYPGDFNGDGKTDILYRSAATDPTAAWFILTSTGKAFNSQAFTFANRPYLTQDNAGSAHHLMVADLNGDGKMDVWHSLDLSSSSSRHNFHYSNGLSFTWESYYTPVSINGSIQANTVIGDFNGDGKPDIFSINSSSMGTFIYPKPFKEERFLTNVVNGLGAQEGFNYSLTNDGSAYSRSWYYEYDTYGIPIGSGINGNPYNVLSAPIYVVNQSYRSNGIGSNLNYTYYNYLDAAYHRTRGFLGYKQVSSTDGATGIQSVTENSINSDLLIPHAIHSYTYLYPDTLSSTRITDTLLKISPYSYFDKRYMHQVLTTVSYNGITGAGSETNNTYDNFGNVTQGITKTGGLDISNNVTAIETTTTTVNYGIHGTPVPASPDNMTVKNTRNGQPEINRATSFTYLPAGPVATKTDFDGLPKAVTTNYTYNGYGSATQIDVSAAGLDTRTQLFTYDYTGRFLIQKEILGNGISKKETYTYESVFGNPETKVSADGLTTSFQYDAFGHVMTTTLPEGYDVTQYFAWENTDGRYSVNINRPGGGSNIKTYYDFLGREVKKESSGFNGDNLVSSKTYNYKEQLENTITPHYSNESAITTTTQFDNIGRVAQISNGTITTTTGYAKYSDGKYQITTTNGAGQSSSKTQDAVGRVISASDNGGTLYYTYDSRGKQTLISLNGINVINNTYDDYGNQASLTDKNAGMITYQHDAFAQLTSQTDALQHTIASTYDPFGRMLTRTGPEGTTAYVYWQESYSGYCNDNLVNVTGFGGEVKEFTYDNLKRLQTAKVTVDGTLYNTQYDYDTYSNPIKTTYSSGIIITRSFDHNGIETITQMGEGIGATTLFTATAMNSLGKYTSYSYGNGRSSTESYNLALGTPTQFFTADIQNLNFAFDAQTGNLTSRSDQVKNLTESFTYDNLNRLTSTAVNNVQQLVLSFDGNSGSSLGNIISKTDAGNYVYNNQKINAVAYVTNPAGSRTPPDIISQNQQDITYTAFLKTSTVSENNYLITYTYGGDYQRIKSVLQQNGSVTETKYYIGEYEKQIKNGITRELHYISAGNGLCAIIDVESGTTNIYYTYTDYQGSILTVTNASGIVMAEQNFDAWGRYRNPADWTYNNVPTQPDWLYRGYTGHEHLKELALINMNGRMYDPILGRMMSVDNYIQDPWNTQSFNKYSYCINNPLIYTDPSGNFFIVDSWISGFIRGLFNGGIVNAWHEANKTAFNDIKIWGGLLTTNPNKTFFGQGLEILSRFTWQLPQEVAGFDAAQIENTYLGSVQNVEYFDGATVLQRTNTNGKAYTLGSFIMGDASISTDPNNSALQHEYGHYLQSQAYGWAYLPFDAIPNVLHTYTNPNDNANWRHDPTEKDGNARSLLYFSKYHLDAKWDFSNNIVDGTNPYLPISDPANQAAARSNLRSPSVFDYFSAFSIFWWPDALINTYNTNNY